MRLKDKVTIITGSSRGIGAATAKLFSSEGASVVINFKTNRSEAEKVFNSLNGKNHMLIQADVSLENDAKRLITETIKKYKRIDILINNAGEIGERGWQVSLAQWKRIIDVNLTSTWLVTREAVPYMQKNETGAIVNLSSTVARGVAAILPYSCAKGGLISFTKAMAVELAPKIRVNAVAPSNVNTDMTKSAGSDLVEFFRQQTPLKRIAEPIELARAILFLASDAASYLTGHILVVDGGYGLK